MKPDQRIPQGATRCLQIEKFLDNLRVVPQYGFSLVGWSITNSDKGHLICKVISPITLEHLKKHLQFSFCRWLRSPHSHILPNLDLIFPKSSNVPCCQAAASLPHALVYYHPLPASAGNTSGTKVFSPSLPSPPHHQFLNSVCFPDLIQSFRRGMRKSGQILRSLHI